MDIRGAERKVADLMFSEPYQGDLYDERFHGFGRTVLDGGEEYVGNFSHGRRHGHGTAVWPDGLKYVGEWHNNAATGVGCLSWPAGAIYVGEVRRGQRHGRGIYRLGDAKYIGEWQSGKRHGWGTQISPDFTYSGCWVDGHRHGWGTVEFSSLNRYSGEWEADKMHGFGTMLWVTLQQNNANTHGEGASETYRKSQRDLLAKLRATITNVGSVTPGPLGPFTPAVPNSTDALEQYSGEWRTGKPNGKGEYTLMFHSHTSNRDVPFEAVNQFCGNFVDGLRHGGGRQHFADGTTYVGTWAANLKEGKGTIYYPDGTTEDVVMRNDSPAENPPQQARGGLGIMALIKIDDLFEGLEAEAAAKQREEMPAIIARASNTLHHLYNVYSAVSCPLDYYRLDEAVVNPDSPPPGPDYTPYLKAGELHVRHGCGALERNATITASITGKVVADTATVAKKGFGVMKQCSADYEIAQSRDMFQMAGSPMGKSGSVTDPMSPIRSPLSADGKSARRPVTPQLSAVAPQTLEAMLPTAFSTSSNDNAPSEVRMTVTRFHALLHDALLVDGHFSLRHSEHALAPLMERQAMKPSNERNTRSNALSFPAFTEAIIRIAYAKIVMSYPFFTVAAATRLTLGEAVQYLVREFLWPLCSALRDLDFCSEFNRLGVDRFVFEASENYTVEDIRKTAIRVLREKAKLAKMKGDESVAVAEPLTMTIAELNSTVRLGETIANLANEASPNATLRRVERPTSASVDAIESMDLPNGAVNEKIAAQVRHKQFIVADQSTTGTSKQLEIWFVVIVVRHATVVHHRLHAVVVASHGTAYDAKRQLVGVIPTAALHRLALVQGIPVPSELRQYLQGGASPHSDVSRWVVPPHSALLGHHLARFGPVARVIERDMRTVVALHRHCGGKLWALVDFCHQLGLTAHFSEFANHTEKQLPTDVLLRNVLFTAMGTLIDDACSAVTAVSECPVPPVYDQQLLRAFLKKTPELASALQIAAIHEDARADRRERFKNLKTPVGVAHWWSFAMEVELTIEEFVVVLVNTAYYIYLGPEWSKRPPASTGAAAAEGTSTPVEEALANAAETSSTVSGATSFARMRMPAPAVTAVAACGLTNAVQSFASAWKLMLDLPIRAHFFRPGVAYDASFAVVQMRVDRAAAKHSRDARRSKPPARTQAAPQALTPAHANHAGKRGGSAAAGDAHGKHAAPAAALPAAAVPPTPSPAALVIRSISGELAPSLPPEVRDLPPVAVDRPLAMRPRTVPVEDPKKKKAASADARGKK